MSIIVRGRVQGVGFRFFTAHSARKHLLSGWVRNSFDGSVAIEVQGPVSVLGTFREEVNAGPVLARVNEMVVTELPVIPDERGFEVRY